MKYALAALVLLSACAPSTDFPKEITDGPYEVGANCGHNMAKAAKDSGGNLTELEQVRLVYGCQNKCLEFSTEEDALTCAKATEQTLKAYETALIIKGL